MKLSEELGKWRIDRPDEWKMDEFMRNAEKLESERDTAMAQNLEQLNNCLAALQIANKRIDELEKYNLDLANESDNKSNMIDYERSKNAELVAHIDAIKDAWMAAGSWPDTGKEKRVIANAINAAPAQHLRDHDAEVIMAVAKFHEEKYGDRHFAFGDSFRQYAEKVRRGEV